MPTGWPEAPHEERDESAFTAGTGTFDEGERLLVGVPWLVLGHHKMLTFHPLGLREVVDWLKLAAQKPA